MEFPERLRQVIGDSTIDEFAQVIEDSPQRVKDVLRGKQKPPMDFLVRIQVRLGVDLNWLLVGDVSRAANALSAREASLIYNYRAATEEGRKAVDHTASAVVRSEDHSVGRKLKRA